MLTRPRVGWSLFTLDEYYACSISYLSDVPMDWLDQSIMGLKSKTAFTVFGYLEPGRIFCKVDKDFCYVAFNDDDESDMVDYVARIDLTMLDFCQKLHDDIEKHIDAWAGWMYFSCDEAINERKVILERKLDELQSLIVEATVDKILN